MAERGVRFSQIFHRGWDQHGNVAEIMTPRTDMVSIPADTELAGDAELGVDGVRLDTQLTRLRGETVRDRSGNGFRQRREVRPRRHLRMEPFERQLGERDELRDDSDLRFEVEAGVIQVRRYRSDNGRLLQAVMNQRRPTFLTEMVSAEEVAAMGEQAKGEVIADGDAVLSREAGRGELGSFHGRLGRREDPRVADYRIVRDPELVRTSDAFLAEGRLVVRALLQALPAVIGVQRISAGGAELEAGIEFGATIRSSDGGETWRLVLDIDENTGINEFVINPANPDEIVASSYQRRRHVWTLINGGPGSGIHRTTDGGTTWTDRLTGRFEP